MAVIQNRAQQGFFGQAKETALSLLDRVQEAGMSLKRSTVKNIATATVLLFPAVTNLRAETAEAAVAINPIVAETPDAAPVSAQDYSDLEQLITDAQTFAAYIKAHVPTDGTDFREAFLLSEVVNAENGFSTGALLRIKGNIPAFIDFLKEALPEYALEVEQMENAMRAEARNIDRVMKYLENPEQAVQDFMHSSHYNAKKGVGMAAGVVYALGNPTAKLIGEKTVADFFAELANAHNLGFTDIRQAQEEAAKELKTQNKDKCNTATEISAVLNLLGQFISDLTAQGITVIKFNGQEYNPLDEKSREALAEAVLKHLEETHIAYMRKTNKNLSNMARALAAGGGLATAAGLQPVTIDEKVAANLLGIGGFYSNNTIMNKLAEIAHDTVALNTPIKTLIPDTDCIKTAKFAAKLLKDSNINENNVTLLMLFKAILTAQTTGYMMKADEVDGDYKLYVSLAKDPDLKKFAEGLLFIVHTIERTESTMDIRSQTHWQAGVESGFARAMAGGLNVVVPQYNTDYAPIMTLFNILDGDIKAQVPLGKSGRSSMTIGIGPQVANINVEYPDGSFIRGSVGTDDGAQELPDDFPGGGFPGGDFPGGDPGSENPQPPTAPDTAPGNIKKMFGVDDTNNIAGGGHAFLGFNVGPVEIEGEFGVLVTPYSVYGGDLHLMTGPLLAYADAELAFNAYQAQLGHGKSPVFIGITPSVTYSNNNVGGSKYEDQSRELLMKFAGAPVIRPEDQEEALRLAELGRGFSLAHSGGVDLKMTGTKDIGKTRVEAFISVGVYDNNLYRNRAIKAFNAQAATPEDILPLQRAERKLRGSIGLTWNMFNKITRETTIETAEFLSMYIKENPAALRDKGVIKLIQAANNGAAGITIDKDTKELRFHPQKPFAFTSGGIPAAERIISENKELKEYYEDGNGKPSQKAKDQLEGARNGAFTVTNPKDTSDVSSYKIEPVPNTEGEKAHLRELANQAAGDGLDSMAVISQKKSAFPELREKQAEEQRTDILNTMKKYEKIATDKQQEQIKADSIANEERKLKQAEADKKAQEAAIAEEKARAQAEADKLKAELEAAEKLKEQRRRDSLDAAKPFNADSSAMNNEFKDAVEDKNNKKEIPTSKPKNDVLDLSGVIEVMRKDNE